MNDVDLSGRAVTRSEVLGYPDTPFGAGTVIAVPEGRTDELWQLVGLPAPAPSALPYLQFHIEGPALARLSAVTAPINLDGTFDLRLTPGTYLFCLSGIVASVPVGGMEVAGCAHGVIESEPGFLSLSYGEGGVRLIGPPASP